MKTTLNKIRRCSPCAEGWASLLKNLGKTQPDDEPLSIVTILDCNGLDDALWCLTAVDSHFKEIRSYAVWCARQVQHLMRDRLSITALDVEEAYAQGNASEDELYTARDAAWKAAWGAPWGVALGQSASHSAAWSAAWATWPAAGSAAYFAASRAAKATAGSAREAQEKELRRVCAEIEAKLKEKV
jgi:hypothetical protein